MINWDCPSVDYVAGLLELKLTHRHSFAHITLVVLKHYRTETVAVVVVAAAADFVVAVGGVG